MTSGVRTPVSSTRNNEIPSIPRCHEMPHGLIHVCLLTNWKSPLDLSNATTTQMLRPAVTALASTAMSFTHSGRRLEKTATRTAPAAGTTTSDVRIGNEVTGYL